MAILSQLLAAQAIKLYKIRTANDLQTKNRYQFEQNENLPSGNFRTFILHRQSIYQLIDFKRENYYKLLCKHNCFTLIGANDCYLAKLI
ncbi:hypothetical protein B0181_05230 [Moraxella caviae]|uniref:Uncharacterized protein n=1 Tax=Moraxella caviae TaxID=34060 RepID=A0A1T0A2X5_9GAMM|nr:hypothetical protein B0181_05230 [Moraxella caviae]STZ14664.1 Uncharacterised protein [Moraxella caviae]VEW13316.1 Uncharacterised protein [Moraxella caviae]